MKLADEDQHLTGRTVAMSNEGMDYVWRDYDPRTMGYVESWLDESAIKSTGLDEGFCSFYEYWASEEGTVVGENLWCKVVFENDKPFAVVALCRHEDNMLMMEVLIAPEKRGQGKGSKLLKELLNCKAICGFEIQKCEAVIYPGNIASQKAFENAGFKYCHHNKDENGESLNYVYERSSTCID